VADCRPRRAADFQLRYQAIDAFDVGIDSWAAVAAQRRREGDVADLRGHVNWKCKVAEAGALLRCAGQGLALPPAPLERLLIDHGPEYDRSRRWVERRALEHRRNLRRHARWMANSIGLGVSVTREHHLLIGEEHAERLKIEVGALDEQAEADVSGRDLLSGLLRRAPVSAPEVQRAVESTVVRIIEVV